MKIAVKTIKFLCAAAIAFAPSASVAFASNSSSKIKVHALTMAEMQSEYGAGGGGGGGNPTPDPGNGGGSSCQYDLDRDTWCDYADLNDPTTTARTTSSGYEVPQLLDATAWIPCYNPNDGDSCTGSTNYASSKSYSFQASITGSGPIKLVELAVGFTGSYTYSTTVSINPFYRVAKGYKTRLEITKQTYQTIGDFYAAFKDFNYTPGQVNQITGYRYTGYWIAKKPTGVYVNYVIGLI
jgi:hypothetical protein